MLKFSKTCLQSFFFVSLMSNCFAANAIEWDGLLDLRVVNSNSSASWPRAGLAKQRYDKQNDGLRLGQAMLRGEAELADALSAVAVFNASDDRKRVFDVTEAWIKWNPVPTGPWKTTVKAGIFFPAISLENTALGWTPLRTISTSAINSWIGEEFRTKGIEVNLSRPGKMLGSPHDFAVSATVFNGNDPAGSLLTWRGWSISDRITGMRERLSLADLPVYRADGNLPKQSRSLNLMRELDGRLGYQFAARYAYAGWLELAAMHYDNRADPSVLKNGQYGWTTRFNHVSARVIVQDWELLMQAMDGITWMGRGGRSAAGVNYRAWYALLSHPLGTGNISLRYDHFLTREFDVIPSDPNGEDGTSIALAYYLPLGKSYALVAEALQVQSERPARAFLGQGARQRERSLTLALRWRF